MQDRKATEWGVLQAWFLVRQRVLGAVRAMHGGKRKVGLYWIPSGDTFYFREESALEDDSKK